MTRVEIGAATLYLGDCLEIMPTLEPASLLVTDPPYRLTSGGKNGGGFLSRRGAFSVGAYNNDGDLVRVTHSFAEWLPTAVASLKVDADAYIMANDKNLGALLAAIEAAGLGLHNVLAWDKVNATPNRWYFKNLEFVAYAWKGRARTIRRPASKQLLVCPQVDESSHPTEKPVSLMRHYIENSSEAGDLVLDPFAGSGSTGVAAIQAGRRFIGIELERRWFDVAAARLERATERPELFSRRPDEAAERLFVD